MSIIYRFTIPSLPSSVNSLYSVNFHTKKIYLSAEGRQFKYTCKMFMPPMKFPKGAKFRVEMGMIRNWNFKNGKPRKADVQNLIKVLLDAIFEKLGVDDSMVYELEAKKIQGEKEQTMVIIRSL